MMSVLDGDVRWLVSTHRRNIHRSWRVSSMDRRAVLRSQRDVSVRPETVADETIVHRHCRSIVAVGFVVSPGPLDVVRRFLEGNSCSPRDLSPVKSRASTRFGRGLSTGQHRKANRRTTHRPSLSRHRVWGWVGREQVEREDEHSSLDDDEDREWRRTSRSFLDEEHSIDDEISIERQTDEKPTKTSQEDSVHRCDASLSRSTKRSSFVWQKASERKAKQNKRLD